MIAIGVKASLCVILVSVIWIKLLISSKAVDAVFFVVHNDATVLDVA